ncbi:chromate transporter [Tsukamurella soli]|uniref:Chromate transporter n=1 Tax=Tsukamurella soli TaxID=644556 RepID=A0ABP8J403_9ACTN
MTADLLRLLVHCSLWSVLAVGGNTVALTDIYHYTVQSQRWLTSTDFVVVFSASQAIPGPNGMALVMIGQKAAGVPGALIALVAKLVPSSVIAYAGSTWYERNIDRPRVRLARNALVPITIGLVFSATFVLAQQVDDRASRIILTAIAAAVTYKTRLNPTWLIAAGTVLGLISTFTGWNAF